MFPQSSDVYIELSQHIYSPGDEVDGFVGLSITKPLEVDRVTVRFSGYLRTASTTADQRVLTRNKQFFDRTIEVLKFGKPGNSSENRPTQRSRVTSDEEIGWAFTDVPFSVNHKVTEDEDFVGLDAGNHKIPIHYKLPEEGLSTSFSSRKCPTSIQYTVTAHLYSGDQLLRVAKLEFPVVTPLPISPAPIPAVQQKVTKQIGKNSRGQVDLLLTMNKTSYLPTEKIDCNITIKNYWKHSLKFVHFSIVQRMVSDASCVQTSAHQVKKVVSVFEHPGVGPARDLQKIASNTCYSFQPEYYIPALIPIQEMPNYFKVEYFARVQVGKAPNWIVAECCVPINVGTHYFGTDFKSEKSAAKMDKGKLPERTNWSRSENREIQPCGTRICNSNFEGFDDAYKASSGQSYSSEMPAMREEILVDLSTPPQSPRTMFSPNNPFLKELVVNQADHW